MKKPRYRPGQHPLYDEALAELRKQSTILDNPAIDSMTRTPNSANDLRGLVQELESKFDRIAKLLDGIGAVFEERKIAARKQGDREPKELPRDLLEKKLVFEACADCILREIDKLKELLKAAEARELKAKETQILLHGPLGNGRLRNGILAEIDGQPCAMDDEGALRIDCEKSPFHQMLVSDYREHISEPWCEAKNAAHGEAYRKYVDQELPKSQRLEHGRRADRILRGDPSVCPPWPKRPEGQL